MTLVHMGPRGSATDFVSIPARVSAAASASDSSWLAGLSLNGPIWVSPLVSWLHTPGAVICPAGNVVPMMTRGTYSAMISSLPTPFCTEHTAPSANTWATAAMAARVYRVFTAMIPKSQGGISLASLRAWM